MTKKIAPRQAFIDWALSKGWAMDRYGHLQKTCQAKNPDGSVGGGLKTPNVYRFKLSRIAVRYEVKSTAGWVRLRSGYFSKLTISEDGTLQGMTR